MQLHALARACAALSVVVLAGCQAGPVTTVHVSGDTTTYTIGATFTDEAAAAVRGSLPQLQEVLRKYSPGPVQVQDEDGVLRVWAAVDATQLSAASSLTGVSNVQVTTGPEVEVTTTLVPATQLQDVILAAVEGEDDADVLGPLLLENTTAQVQLKMDGTVTYSSNNQAQLDGGTATLSRGLEAGPDTWVVRAEPGQINWVLLVGVGVVVAGAAGLAVSTLRSRRR